MEKMIGIWLDEDDHKEFKAICVKDGTPIKKRVKEMIQKEIKEHGDGNPAFTLDQFQDPNFVACPAVFRDGQSWDHYLSKQTPEELEKFKNQIILIDKKLSKHL